MQPVMSQKVEIAIGHFTIDVYKDPSGAYRAEYYGSGLVQVQAPGTPTPLMEDIPGGKIPNCADVDTALAKARGEIEKRYGKIIRAHAPKES
jgi:hypothetical protein